MVITAQNDPAMLHPVPHPEELKEIRELNRLFLVLLQGRARHGAECLGLATSVARQIRDASPAIIEGMSAFPRALFVLNLGRAEEARGGAESSDDELGRSRHALTLTVLLTAWNMSRQRSFQARMFLGLSVREAGFLSTLPLSELHRVAPAPGLLACAFPQAKQLWATLLRHAERGLPPALRLVGLQPRLVGNLPPRGTALSGHERQSATAGDFRPAR